MSQTCKRLTLILCLAALCGCETTTGTTADHPDPELLELDDGEQGVTTRYVGEGQDEEVARAKEKF
jgi:hypothetical protein